MQLPVCGMEQEIMEAVSVNDVVILCSETGSGKSTQVPQFLYEAAYGEKGLIGVTQPRRVAAVSTSERVAFEMNTKCGKGGSVGYQVRYDSSGDSEETKIRFLTDGILLQHIQGDLMLSDYSVVLLDEAHERNLNTDILLGLLSRAVPLRRKAAEKGGPPPLKLIIMSATLRTSDFTENEKLFPRPPPVITVASRQHPVTVHFNKRTEEYDYIGEAYAKVCKIHRKLPEGGVLVFVTGKLEVLQLCRRLQKEFGARGGSRSSEVEIGRSSKGEQEAEGGAVMDRDEEDDLEEQLHEEAGLGDESADDSSGEEEGAVVVGETGSGEVGPVVVLPLFAMLSRAAQAKVFEPVPEGHRLIVVATNVAETSVTIPNIKYVVDTGRQKTKELSSDRTISQLKVGWISQASADQRAGRAGRVGPGHCYRLYSSAVFSNQLRPFSQPEILTRALEDVILRMKYMGITDVGSFPFVTPPPVSGIREAHRLLRVLAAVDEEGNITQVGKALALVPIGVRFAKMLLTAVSAGVMEHTLALVALLSERDPFLRADASEAEGNAEDDSSESEGEVDMRERKRRLQAIVQQWRSDDGDPMGRLMAAGAYAHHTRAGTLANGEEFCRENLLHASTMHRSLQLRQQLTRMVNLRFGQDSVLGGHAVTVRASMPPPSAGDVIKLKQVLLSGLVDNVARRAPPGTVKTGSAFRRNCPYISCKGEITEPLYIKPGSSLFSGDPSLLPEFVTFTDIVRQEKRQGNDPMAYMLCCTPIEPKWLARLTEGTPLLRLGKPLTSFPRTYSTSHHSVMCHTAPKYGHRSWTLPAHEVKLGAVEGPEEERRWFARLLLEGKVAPALKRLPKAKAYNDEPGLITHNKPLKKVSVLLSQLDGVTTLPALRELMKQKPKALLGALKLWVKQEHRGLLQKALTELAKE
ncbi:unnamed protein product [Chrysoparadoxa australica]